MVGFIIILVTAVGIPVVLAVVARVLGHPLITRTHVNGLLVDVDFWHRKEAENDEEFETGTQGTENGVTGTDHDDAGETNSSGIHSETSRSSTAFRRWNEPKFVRREDFGRVFERCDAGTHGEAAVQGCGDGEVFVTTDGIRIITRRPQRGVTTPKRVHGMMTKWNLKYNIFEESEGLWDEEFGSEYKEY